CGRSEEVDAAIRPARRVRLKTPEGSAVVEETMAFAYTTQERADLNAKANALLSACPDVGSFIRQGLSGNPDTEALVYLRTALDPAPVITKAGDMIGLLRAARRWLRRNGIEPGDIISLFAPNCTATSIAYWAAMSTAAVQPLNLLFTREAIAA